MHSEEDDNLQTQAKTDESGIDCLAVALSFVDGVEDDEGVVEAPGIDGGPVDTNLLASFFLRSIL